MNARHAPARLALFMPSFRPGGAERVMATLAGGFAARGFAVDVLVAQNEGAHAPPPHERIRIVDLRAPRVLAALPALVRYLRVARPDSVLAALPHANVAALWAKSLSGSAARLVVAEHTTASLSAAQARRWRARVLPFFMRRGYRRADGIVAVSEGVASDLADFLALERARISRIYNPIVSPALLAGAEAALDHPWFAPGQPPVLLGAGRLSAAKDFPTLLRAFARLRRERPLRLVILGEGEERGALESLARELGVADEVALPGHVENPFRYMRRAAAFALSSRWEGLSNVLVEAMASGAPVVSTDCPHGPREILEGGRHGALVPPGDDAALARAVAAAIDAPRPRSAAARAAEFSVDAALDRYAEVLGL